MAPASELGHLALQRPSRYSAKRCCSCWVSAHRCTHSVKHYRKRQSRDFATDVSRRVLLCTASKLDASGWSLLRELTGYGLYDDRAQVRHGFRDAEQDLRRLTHQQNWCSFWTPHSSRTCMSSCSVVSAFEKNERGWAQDDPRKSCRRPPPWKEYRQSRNSRPCTRKAYRRKNATDVWVCSNVQNFDEIPRLSDQLETAKSSSAKMNSRQTKKLSTGSSQEQISEHKGKVLKLLGDDPRAPRA